MRFGFNPKLIPINRQSYVDQLRLAIENARRLEFDVIEISLTLDAYELGLSTVFGGDFFDVMKDAPSRFHLHLFHDTIRRTESSLTDPQRYPRSIAMRRIVQVVEFFEHNHPIEMYVIHPGRRVAEVERHLRSLQASLTTLDNLFPGLPMAIENGDPEGVLANFDTLLAFLDDTPNTRFSFHTGLSFHSVGTDHSRFEDRLGYMRRFDENLAEIRWHNTAPGREPSLPLHAELEEGLDLAKIVRALGRNPGTVHLIETAGNDTGALTRERRALHSAFSA